MDDKNLQRIDGIIKHINTVQGINKTKMTHIYKLTKEKCDLTIKINMKGEFNSLNVSNAASILMFEFLRQQGVWKKSSKLCITRNT